MRGGISIAPSFAQELVLFPPAPLSAALSPPRREAARPNSIWAALRFTVKEYPLIPFERLKQLGVGTIYPHFGRMRVTPQGVELYDFYGNVLWPAQKAEMRRMVGRLHAEGFRVVPWLSVKRAKPEGSFWIYDDWTPMLRLTKALVDELGLDGFQLDPEPLNVRDVPALNTGLGWMKSVMGDRELSVATPNLVPGTPVEETGFRWPDLTPFEQLTHADSLCLMTYDSRHSTAAGYQAFLRENLSVAKALHGKTRVYMGMPAYYNVPEKPAPVTRGKKGAKKAAKPAPPPPAHQMPPEDGRTFALGLKGHPDLKYLAGVAVYDLEEPEDASWLATWRLAEQGLEMLKERSEPVEQKAGAVAADPDGSSD